jgi:hypothetical protein
MIDPSGVDTGREWIELQNREGHDLELAGLALAVKSSSAGTKQFSLREGVLPAHGYYVLGSGSPHAPTPGVDAYYGTQLGALSQEGGAIALRCGTSTIDEVSWTTRAKSGRSRLWSSEISIDGSRVSCDAPAPRGEDAVGTETPGEANPPCSGETNEQRCAENGALRPIHRPASRDLLITEIMADPHAAEESTGEWVEVLAINGFDLNGLTFRAGARSQTLESPDCLAVQKGELAVLARSLDPLKNGGLPTPRALFAIPLSNQGTVVSLSWADAGIDSVPVEGVQRGRSRQADRNALGFDCRSFCNSTTRWHGDGDGGGDFGTPGLMNEVCANP